MKQLVGSVLLLLLLAGCSNSPFRFLQDEANPRTEPVFTEFAVAPTFVPQTIVLTALGDSLTQGVGDEDNRGGYVGRLAVEMTDWPGVEGVMVQNTAKRGRRSDQLLAMFQEGKLTGPVTKADYIVMTVGGNDVMKVVKNNLFSLTPEAFYEELELFDTRYRNIITQIRALNENAPIIMLGIYNPLSIFTGDATEFDDIIAAFNEEVMEVIDEDPQACFIPVSEFFYTNENLVYHTDFFHPNAKGYDLMTERILERMQECDIAFGEEAA
ncbi:GDSL-type esterase/lipase family protein [Planococcus lenghuensis]|uniref:GDSL family lipase n=1 Tax=Planococcus lenghuensis TaxID=2213202 RepID=A0A1Q2KZ91_9BACL|nr:GDSL-type esterase/lipase family protein [Planococcus lenghuensis]AQQ53519.1 GDSL family lipase [Planococcus lenghuensis]